MLRAPSRSPLANLIASVLIVALTAASLPVNATASIPEGQTSRLTKTAFGELIAHTGTDPQPYAFAGEPYDPNSGFQYHRARWMDPRTGRFTGMDAFGGFSTDPKSLHKYTYAGSNAVNSADPSGHAEISIAGLTVTFSVAAVIRGVSTVAMGAVLGTLTGGADAYLAGGDSEDIFQEARAGGLIGLVTGPLVFVKYVGPIIMLAGSIGGLVGSAQALQDGNWSLAAFRGGLGLAGSVGFMRSGSVELPRLGGILGTRRTRALDSIVGDILEGTGAWEIIGGGGRFSQEYLPPLSGRGRRGSNFVDVTARNKETGKILRVQTVDTYADGVTPTLREGAAAALIKLKRPNDDLILVPKSLAE